MAWGFYGRQDELAQLRRIVGRGRWFFVKVTGRRRIGKTTLIQQALMPQPRRMLYVQIPDSALAGVLSAFADQMDTFEVDHERFRPPRSLLELAATIASMARAGYLIALDEFQYFHRDRLREFTSRSRKPTRPARVLQTL